MITKMISWKENKIISIQLRNGVYVLGQMIKKPYLIFFKVYSKDGTWNIDTLSVDDILFCHAVTRQFLKLSQIKDVKGIHGLEGYGQLFKFWIISGEFERMTFWKGTKNERTFITAGLHNCLLVEKDIQEDSKNTHLPGVYKKEIRKLTVKDYDSVKAYELTTIEIYPNLNERLYLCYKLKKNVDPEKDIMFRQQIPLEYKTYLDIISGVVPLSNLGY